MAEPVDLPGAVGLDLSGAGVSSRATLARLLARFGRDLAVEPRPALIGGVGLRRIGSADHWAARIERAIDADA